MTDPPPTPITILTGFLGSGKTTLILNLLPQLPSSYKLAFLKNEFGDVAIDTQLASRSSIAGVQELLNGCICCNLVGQLGDALHTLRSGVNASESQTNNSERSLTRAPDRIVIETSGSAFPATLAMEVNRLARETGAFALDGVVSVIDAENWQGYEDTSVTAKMQARYTDLIVLNKSELVSARRLDDVLDRIGDLDLDPPVPCIKSERGSVEAEAILGLDGALARGLGDSGVVSSGHEHEHGSEGKSQHQNEVEVISVSLLSDNRKDSVDLAALEKLLKQAPKDEVYRIKAVLRSAELPKSSDDEDPVGMLSENGTSQQPANFILNWAFGRWTFTMMGSDSEQNTRRSPPVLKMTVVTAKFESSKWIRRIKANGLIKLQGSQNPILNVDRVV